MAPPPRRGEPSAVLTLSALHREIARVPARQAPAPGWPATRLASQPASRAVKCCPQNSIHAYHLQTQLEASYNRCTPIFFLLLLLPCS